MAHTDDELALLATTPQLIGSAVATAGSSGLFGEAADHSDPRRSRISEHCNLRPGVSIRWLSARPRIGHTLIESNMLMFTPLMADQLNTWALPMKRTLAILLVGITFLFASDGAVLLALQLKKAPERSPSRQR